MRASWWRDDEDALDGGAAPAAPSPFIGRRKQLTEGDQLLAPGVRLALVGAGPGAGAGALAWELARRSRAFPGGVRWWSLRRDGAAWAAAVGRWVVELPAPGGPSAWLPALQAPWAAEVERDGPMLFVLDGVGSDHLGLVKALLAAAPESAGVVVTSRMPLPGFTAVSVGGLALVDGLAMLRAVCGANLPQNEAVALVEAAEGLPLALSMLGRRYRRDPTSQAARLLQPPEPALVDGLTADALSGNAAMIAGFLALLADLPGRARRSLRAASTVHSGLLREVHVAALAGLSPRDARADLDDAGQRGLVEAGPDRGTWLLHPTLRGWLGAALAVTGERREVETRHAEHFLRLAARPDDLLPPGSGALASLLPDVTAALTFAGRGPLGQEVERLGHADGGWLAELGAASAAPAPVAPPAPAPRPARVADPAAVRRRLSEVLDEATNQSLAADEAAAQAAVWVEAGRADVGQHPSAAVATVLDGLIDAGRRAEVEARAAAEAVEQMLTATDPDALDDLLDAIANHAAAADEAANDAEARWQDLERARRDERVALDNRSRLVREARRESTQATQVLEATRASIKEVHDELPDPQPAPVAEAWAGVPRALAAAMQAVREATSEAEAQLPRPAEVARLRAVAEQHCQTALQAAMEAERIARMQSSQREAIEEVQGHLRRATESAARFRAVRGRIRALLTDLDGSEVDAIVVRLDAMSAAVDDGLELLTGAQTSVRTAGQEAERRRLQRDAGRAAQRLATQAVEALNLLPEAEGLSTSLQGFQEQRAIRRSQERAKDRLAELDTRAREVEQRAWASRDAVTDPRSAAEIEAARQAAGAAVDAAKSALKSTFAATDRGMAADNLSAGLGAAAGAEELLRALVETLERHDGDAAAREAAEREQLAAQIAAREAAARAVCDRVEAQLAELTELLTPVESPEADDAMRRCLGAAERVRFAAESDRSPAGPDLAHHRLDELRRAASAADARSRDAEDAARVAADALSRGREAHAAWLTERRHATATLDDLGDRLDALRDDLESLHASIDHHRVDLAEPPHADVERDLEEAADRLRVAVDAAASADAALRDLDPAASLRVFGEALTRTETALRLGVDAAAAVRARLASATASWSRAVAERAEARATAERLPALAEQGQGLLRAAERAVEEQLASLPPVFSPDDDPTDDVRAALRAAQGRLADLLALVQAASSSERLSVVQAALSDGDNLVEDIAADAERARALAARAAARATEEAHRLVQRRAERVARARHALDGASERATASAAAATATWDTLQVTLPGLVRDLPEAADEVLAARDAAATAATTLGGLLDEAADEADPDALHALATAAAAAADDAHAAAARAQALAEAATARWARAERARLDALADALDEARAGLAAWTTAAPADVIAWDLEGATRDAWERERAGARGVYAIAGAFAAWLRAPTPTLAELDVEAATASMSRELQAADDDARAALDAWLDATAADRAALTEDVAAAVAQAAEAAEATVAEAVDRFEAVDADARREDPALLAGPRAAAADALAWLQALPAPADAALVRRSDADRHRARLADTTAEFSARAEAAARARAAFADAVAAARAGRRAALAAALSLCRQLAEEVSVELHSSLGLADDGAVELTEAPDVAAHLESLRALATEAAARQEDIVGHSLVVAANDDPDAVWPTLLAVASATGASLRARLIGQPVLVQFEEALARATRDELAAARERAAAATRSALDEEQVAAGWLTTARRLTARWSDHAPTHTAATRAAEGASELLNLIGRCVDLSTAAARTASLRQARGIALQVDALTAMIADHRARVQATLAEAEGNVDAAAEVELDDARARAVSLAAAIADADADAWSLVEVGVERSAGWSLPPVGAALGRLLAPSPRLARLTDRAAALRDAVVVAAHPDAARPLLVELTSLATQATTLQGAAADALDDLDAELELRLPEQLDAFDAAAGDALSAVDGAVAVAVAARMDGEGRVESLTGPTVSQALAELVRRSTAAQNALSEGRAIAARLRDAASGRAGRALLDDALDAAAQVAITSDATLAARDALERAADTQQAVDADRAYTIQRLRSRIDAAQISYDEIELTVEASREALADAPPAVAERWQALLLETGEVSREIARARTAARRAAATLSADDLADAREEADGALQAAEDETARLSASLPELLGTQIQYAQATRDLLESRMSTRHTASRVERFAADLAAASADALAALADLPDGREEWQVASAALDALRELRSTFTDAREGAEATDDAAVARAHAADADAAFPDAEALWQTGKAACVRLVRQRAAERRARAIASHAEHHQWRSRAAWVLGQRAPLAAELRRWSRAVARWAAPWSDDDAVAAAAADALTLVSAALERDVEVVEAARRAISAPTLALAAERVEAAEATIAALHAETLSAHAAVVAAGEAVQAAHAAATARREAYARRQAEAAQAIERLRTGLGAAGPATRIPLFEKGLAVARLRGDKRALLGWLLDTAELYDDVGRLADARRCLDEAVGIAPELGDDRLVAAWLSRGRHLHRSGDPAAGKADLLAALDRTEDRSPIADDLHGELGLALLRLGDEDEARSELELAAELAHVAGDVRSTGLHLGRLARLASAAGDLDEAEHHANAAAEAMHAAGDRVGLAAELARRADILRRLGRVAEAVQVAEEALDVAAHDEGLAATLRAVLGWCWLSAGQPARANAEFTAAAELAAGRGDGAARAHARAGQAACARAQATGGPALTPGLAWAASKETRRRSRRTDRLGLDRGRPLPDQLAAAAAAWADAADQALAIGDLPAAALRRTQEAEARAALGDAAAAATAEAALSLLARLPRPNEALEAAARRVASPT
jgi:hypothetical protein